MSKYAHLNICPAFWFHSDPVQWPFLIFWEQAML